MISVKGKIIAPDDEKKNRREILVEDKSEYDKLPLDIYPITHVNEPGGIAATLIYGDDECEVSFHRYPKDSRFGEVFYIGSAYRRLGSRVYTKTFRRFLEKAGITKEGIPVKLEFDGYKIKISKI